MFTMKAQSSAARARQASKKSRRSSRCAKAAGRSSQAPTYDNAFVASRASMDTLRSTTASASSRASSVAPVQAVIAEAPPVIKATGAVNEKIRNIAIIAHVDHGKTTLVDAMLAQSKVFRDNEKVEERIMDNDAIEKERGITILAKNTAITYKGTKINIIDTPGHADFGGEVERVLNMVDGVLLLVDAQEGPMPQTRFVLKKALEMGHTVMVVVNKIDRENARPDWVVDTTFDLFCDLATSDDQCEFPTVFASGYQGIAGLSPDALAEDLEPLFQSIVENVPPPSSNATEPLQMLCTNIDYDEFKGRIAIGRVQNGTISAKESIKLGVPDAPLRNGKVTDLFIYENFGKTSVETVVAGDICAVAGLPDIQIGETLVAADGGVPLPAITVEEPTVRMTFMVNISPFSGKEGKFVTSRNIKDRLDRELERNLALTVEPGESADQFIVSGRGTLHLSILIENMRREGYEFIVGPPAVIYKEDANGGKLEPFEEVTVEVGEEFTGACVDMLANRKGVMLNMEPSAAGTTLIKYKVPTRGLMGVRNQMLTATKGTAVLNTLFDEYGPFLGDMSTRDMGSLVAHETGTSTGYAMMGSQERGVMLIDSNVEVYEGQIVGIHQRAGDLKVNVCKKKQLNNMRASGKDDNVKLVPPRVFSLDDSLEYIQDDELVEITPKSIRLLKNPFAPKKQKGGKK